MYYLDHQAMQNKLQVLQHLTVQMQVLNNSTDAEWRELHGLAQERLLHLAMEAVTDIGHMLIDCFMMRDAGSYEDIIEILHEEKVFATEVNQVLMALVRLKSLLVKQYEVRLMQRHELLAPLVHTLPVFAEHVHSFIRQEFVKIGQ